MARSRALAAIVALPATAAACAARPRDPAPAATEPLGASRSAHAKRVVVALQLLDLARLAEGWPLVPEPAMDPRAPEEAVVSGAPLVCDGFSCSALIGRAAPRLWLRGSGGVAGILDVCGPAHQDDQGESDAFRRRPDVPADGPWRPASRRRAPAAPLRKQAAPAAGGPDRTAWWKEIPMSPKQATRKNAARAKKAGGFSEEERSAMRERAQELKAEARANKDKAYGERDVLEKIAAMPEADRAMATRLHALVQASAPSLSPKTWYGMPAYAKDDKVVCFFQSAQKFKTRYSTFGFSDQANLDDGHLWPTAFALTKLTPKEEARIGALVKRAVS